MTTQHWIDRDGTKAQLVVLTDEAVYSETFSAAECQRLVRELAAGASPTVLFGKDASVIPLRAVKRVQIDDNDNDVDLTSLVADKEHATSVRFAENDVRDAVYAALRDRLAPKLREHVDEYSRPRAAVGSLTALTVFGGASLMLAKAAAAIQAADELEITGRRAAFKKMVAGVLDTLGPTGVWLIGGTLCLIAVFVFVRRMRQPPRVRFVQAAPWNGPSNVATLVKYGLLVTAWGFAFKAALA